MASYCPKCGKHYSHCHCDTEPVKLVLKEKVGYPRNPESEKNDPPFDKAVKDLDTRQTLIIELLFSIYQELAFANNIRNNSVDKEVLLAAAADMGRLDELKDFEIRIKNLKGE